MNTPIKTYKLAKFTLDLVKKELYKAEKKLKMSDKEFDVLLCLIENRPQTLSHDKIIKSVWNGTAVENSSVEKAIANIRKVLGDNARNPTFIKTIYGEGYRFIADIEKVEETPKKLATPKSISQIEEGNKIKSSSKSYSTFLGIGIVILSLILGIVFWKVKKTWTQVQSEVIFADNFSDNDIDLQKWNFRGNSVIVENGTVKLTVDEVDNWGVLQSSYFDFYPDKQLTIKSRIRITYSKNLKETFMVGSFGIVPKNNISPPDDEVDTHFYGIKYANYDDESVIEDDPITKDYDETMHSVKTEGFFLVKNGGRPHRQEHYWQALVGPRIEPVWDEWFEQKIVYDPVTEKMSYFVNDKKRGEYFVGKLPLDAGENKIRLEIIPWGWYLHHSIEIDYIEITQ